MELSLQARLMRRLSIRRSRKREKAQPPHVMMVDSVDRQIDSLKARAKELRKKGVGADVPPHDGGDFPEPAPSKNS